VRIFWIKNKILIGFFVCLTAATSYSFFDQSDEDQKALTAKITAELQKNAQQNAARSPASIDTTKIKPQSQKLKVFCDNKDLHFHFERSLVMLEVNSCQKLQGKHQIWIRNLSNGFKAQVFKISEQNFKTDFLQLNNGVNKIEIEGILKDGQKIVQKLEIQSGS
jgi:hypothetical protein